MEAPNITMDSPSELENTNSLLVSTETPETGVLDSESQIPDKTKTQPTLLTKPFVKNTSTPKIELDGLDWLDVKTPTTKKPPVIAIDVDKTAKKLASDFKTFQAEKNALEADVAQFNKIASTSVATPELVQKEKELAERSSLLNATANELQKTSRRVEIDRFELKKTAVRSFAEKAKEGSVLGATWNSIVNGYKNTGLGYSRIAIDLGIELLDKIGIPWASKEDMKSMTKDEAKKKVIADMTPIITKGYDVAKSKGTTEEFIQKRKDSGTIPKAWYGAMESASAMASGSKVGSFITGSVMGYQAINDEIDKSNDPILRNLDENTRKQVTLPIALVNGAIEVVNFITLGSGFAAEGGIKAAVAENLPGLAKFTGYVLSKLPENATVKMITESAKQLAATPTGKMILTSAGELGAAYAVEGTAGGLQAINNQVVKEIYDKTHNMDLFKNPEFFSKQFLGKIADDFNTEGVGGIMLRSIGMGASTLMNATGSSTISDEAYQMWSTLAQDKDQRDLYLAKIKADLASERITVDEAKNRMSTLENAVDIASQIPIELPVGSQKKAFGILNNNRLIENRIKELEDYMAGKNPNLVTSVQSEIDGLRDQINKNNTELSKLPKNAIQEQTTSEVPVQPEAGVSGEVAEGESKPETKVSAEESKKQKVADIESRREDAMMAITKEAESMTQEQLDKTAEERLNKRVELNDKFDAELAALEKPVTPEIETEEVDRFLNTTDQDTFNKLTELKQPNLSAAVNEIEALNLPLEENNKRIAEVNEQYKEEAKQTISEAYNKAKEDGSNPELVSAIDSLIKDKKEKQMQQVADAFAGITREGVQNQTPTEEVKVEEVTPTEEVKPTEMSEDEWTKVQDLANRISEGKEVTSPEDLQLQQNYPRAIEKLLANKTKVTSKEESTKKPELPSSVFDAMDKATSEDLTKDLIAQAGIDALQSSPEYKNMSEQNRQLAIDEVNKKAGVKRKAAPSAKKILGVTSEKTIVNQTAALKEQLGLANKAAKSAVDFINNARKIVIDAVKNMPSGALDPKATKALLSALSGNINTPEQRKVAISKVIEIFKKSEGKVAIEETTALKERLKLIDKSIKEGQLNFKNAIKDIASEIKAILPKGKFSTSQVKVVANAMASNLLNPKIRDKAMARIERVANNVEEATKLAKMYDIRTSLKDARKRGLDVNIIDMVNNFIDIDPKFIEDFDEYLNYASRAYEASKAIKFVKDENGNKVLDPRAIDSFRVINDYSNRQLEKQEEILKENLLDQYKSLVDSGALKADMSLQQMKAYIKSVEENEKNQDDEKDQKLRDYANKSFDDSREILQAYLDDDGIDRNERELIQGFINIDINDLSPMQAYEAAESLMNYRVNGSTSKMGKVLANYKGAAAVKELSKEINIEDRVNVGGTRRLRYKALGKSLDALIKGLTFGKAKPKLAEKLPNAYSDFWFKYNSALDNLGTTYFGPENWTVIRDASGLNKIIDGNEKRKKIIDEFSKEMSDKYKDKKIGDNNVFTQYAQNEIGVIAKLYRETSDPKKQDAYFNDRRNVLKEDIEDLKSSKNEEENKEGQMLEDIYKKLDIDNAKNGQEIFDRADPVAQDIINDFINKFGEYYPEFARITQQQHNIILGNDKNYTADTWLNVYRDPGNESDKIFKKGSFKSNNIVETEASGRFQQVKYPSSLKKVKGKVVNRPSYNFMQNNINALSETIGDIYTIEGRNQFAGFIDSPYLEQLIQDENSRKLFTDRAIFDISLLTGNEIIPRRSQLEKDAARGLAFIGNIATKAGLSSLESIATQSIPVVTATAFNLDNPAYLAKAIADFANPFDSAARDFVNNLNYGISNRGPSSQTSIDYVENLLEKGDYSNADKLLQLLGKSTGVLINTGLVGTDVVTAKSTWLAYYMDALANQGESPMSIDWSTHEVNDKAARYAEAMVQKEQNLNTPELAGKLWASKDPRLKIVRSFMPFAGFSVKQKDKIKTNMSTLFKKSNLATKEQKFKAARSLTGTLFEQYTFNAIKAAIIGYAVKGIINPKQTKEEEKLKDKKAYFKQIADLFETFNGSMDFFEKEASAQINNKLLDVLENSLDKYANGSPKEYESPQEFLYDFLDLFKKPKQEKEKKSPYNENQIPKSQERIKKEKLKKELKKRFRFYESADADIVETLFNVFGGSIKVLGNAQWKAIEGILDASKGYFEIDGEKVKYTPKETSELRSNIPFYLATIFAPGLVPTTVSKLFNEERKIIGEAATMRYKKREAGRKRVMREMGNK